ESLRLDRHVRIPPQVHGWAGTPPVLRARPMRATRLDWAARGSLCSAGARGALVRQRIHNEVHPQLVRLVRDVNGHPAGVRELPRLADVPVAGEDRHQTLAAVVVLEDAVPDDSATVVLRVER